jgi:hypothetical protein
MPLYFVWVGRDRQAKPIEAPDAQIAISFWLQDEAYESREHAAKEFGVEVKDIRAEIAPGNAQVRQVKAVPESAEDMLRMLTVMQQQALSMHPGVSRLPLGSDTWVALGELLGHLAKLRALVGRDIDDMHRADRRETTEALRGPG